MILTTNPSLINITTATEVKQPLPRTTSGPASYDLSQSAVYNLTEYKHAEADIDEDNRDAYIARKSDITWVMWVNNGLMGTKLNYIKIEPRTLMAENENDFTLNTNVSTFQEDLKQYGYLEATIEVLNEGGETFNRLTIKFSKWLDGMNVYIEPFFNSPDHIAAKAYVSTTEINSPPEIFDVYWLNSAKNPIVKSGFSREVFLAIRSIGLTNETLTISLLDSDSDSSDDALFWNGSVNKEITVSERLSLIPLTIESADSSDYASAISDDSDPELEFYITLASSNADINLSSSYAPLDVIASPNVRTFFGKRRTVKIDGDDVYFYDEISSAILGEKIYLIAETTNLAEEVSFSVFDESNCFASDVPLALIVGETELTEFTVHAREGFTVQEITLKTLDSDEYNTWLEHLMPEDDNAQPNSLLFEADLRLHLTKSDDTIVLSNNTLVLKAPVVEQKIYFDGSISKEEYPQDLIKRVKYSYYPDIPNTKYDFGTFDVIWVQRWVKGYKSSQTNSLKVTEDNEPRWYVYDGKGTKRVPLVTIFGTQGKYGPTENDTNPTNSNGEPPALFYKEFEHSANNVRIIRITEDTNREYFNPVRLAAVLGAIIDSGYDDIMYNGSVGTDGTGAPSVSHINGNNVDFKYLRNDTPSPLRAKADMIGGIINFKFSWAVGGFDKERQNLLNASFYKFGFGRKTHEFRSWDINYSNNQLSKEYLDHCANVNDSPHNHHLHIEGFDPIYHE